MCIRDRSQALQGLVPGMTFGVDAKGGQLKMCIRDRVCIENLQQGINWVNSLDYGLTSGLQSLDEGEQKLWKDSIMAEMCIRDSTNPDCRKGGCFP